MCAVQLPGSAHPADRTGLPEGEGPALHARLLGHAERQPAAEHGVRFEDGAQRAPAADLQVSPSTLSPGRNKNKRSRKLDFSLRFPNFTAFNSSLVARSDEIAGFLSSTLKVCCFVFQVLFQ